MKLSILCTLLLVAVLNTLGNCGNSHQAVSSSSGRYVITLRNGVAIDEQLRKLLQTSTADSLQGDSPESSMGIQKFAFPKLRVFAGRFDTQTIAKLKVHPAVDTIEPDLMWKVSSRMLTQDHVGYGLSQICHRERRTTTDDDRYTYDQTAGRGTFAYVVDSGINVKHDEFEDRAKLGYNAIKPDTRTWTDDFGHGTHIAGIIGSKTFGVAKKTNLIAVKVVERDTGLLSHVLEGLQWAIKDILQGNRMAKSVINMSLYGPRSAAMEKVFDEAQANDISVVIPAGNDGQELTSRDGVNHPLIVSATDAKRKKAPFANWGRQVSLFAPGTRIMSTLAGSKTAVGMGSGTSQASAYVAGLVVYFKNLHYLPDAKATKAYVLKEASSGVVSVPNDDRALFAYNGCGK